MTRVRRPPLLIAISGVLVIALATLLLTAFGPATHIGSDASPKAGPASAPPPAPENVPVLLVHGYKGNPGQMKVIAQRLERDGRRVVSVALPEHGTGDLRVAAFAVGLAARSLNVPRVDVVGYSLGGLVARSWLLFNDPVVSVRHLVMLSTPNGGIGLPLDSGLPYQESCDSDKACRQLRPASSFLRVLDGNPSSLARAGWLTVASESDRLVRPTSIASMPNARNVIVQQFCPDLIADHGDMPRAPEIVGLVRLYLDDQLPDRPTCPDLLSAGQ